MKLVPFNGTFGMPPQSHVSDTAIINSMPIMEITPGKPNFESGLSLFSVTDDWQTYLKILNTLGFQLSEERLRFAFIADNFPVDTFTNEYGETFLQKFTDVASQGMQQIVQMTGSKTFTGATKKLGGAFKNIGEGQGGIVGDIISGAGAGFEATGEALQNLKSSMQGNSFLGGAAGMIDKMMGGYRVDFPQIWRNSGYTPSYTATVRLYNPNPGSFESTKRHIVGPLAAILCLSIPRSDDGKTFNWPFFHKIKSDGIYNLDPAVITNVTVVKGGDQQQISYRQSLAMVDVRIDITSLYSTMVLEENATFQAQRPTVNNYLDSLLDMEKKGIYKRNAMRIASGNSAGQSQLQGPNIKISALPQFDASVQNSVELALAKNAAARKRSAPTVLEQEVQDRVTTLEKAREASLIAASNRDFVGNILA